MTRQLLLLEFNEINFEYVQQYCRRGVLPNLRRIIDENGWATTESEREYDHLEPWIQWVTAHTGQTLSEHGVFRLGDIVNHDLPQIWEMLEEHGLKVGAICPMNAKHRMRAPAFFVPDPWTPTRTTAPWLLERLSAAISQAVNDNAQSRVTAGSALNLLAGVAAYALPENYPRYAGLTLRAFRQPWKRALFLDQLLADIFVRETRRTQPHFASLFLNAGAHIQHHYMFSSPCYGGPHRNPDWYAPAGEDPVFEAYELYDRVLGKVRREFPTARIMIATGLHQVPHPELTYYWRLRDHAAFLRAIGVPFRRVDPRMSRDFLITCDDEGSAVIAADRLRHAVAEDGYPLFEVDNRGTDIFVMLVYPKAISPGFRFTVGKNAYPDLSPYVAFVALKNGAHDGTGYLLDSAARRSDAGTSLRLAAIPGRIMDAFGLAGMPSNSATHPVAARTASIG